MLSALKQFGILRSAVLGLLVLVVSSFLFAFVSYTDPAGYKVDGTLNLAGFWEFHNGALDPASALGEKFEDRVEVPKMLPEEIRKNLKDEFWYRSKFTVPPNLIGNELSISLGSIKGKNEIYLNGNFVGGGGQIGLSLHRVPKSFFKPFSNILTVRVRKSDSIYPGIMHFQPVVIGSSDALESTPIKFSFEVGVKPLLHGGFKIFCFGVFALLLFAMPSNKEYLSFSIYALTSGLSAMANSRFMPFAEDFFAKNLAVSFFRTLSFSLIPLLAVQFLRKSTGRQQAALLYGISVAAIINLAAFFSVGEAKLGVYRISGEYVSLLTMLPFSLIIAFELTKIELRYTLRRIQLALFSTSLLIGALAWSVAASYYLRFVPFYFFDLLDVTIFAGMALSMTLDFRIQSNRARGAGKIVPKWFNGFLSSGITEAKLELPMICLALDTVGYTRILSKLNDRERKELHQCIIETVQSFTTDFGAQKLSDRGDGALFGWDYPRDELSAARVKAQIENASKSLISPKLEKLGLQFRVGIAAGQVMAEMRDGQFSFLGQALNAACRLEPLAKAGEPLLDISVVHFFPDSENSNWVEIEIKGVIYRGRPLLQSPWLAENKQAS